MDTLRREAYLLTDRSNESAEYIAGLTVEELCIFIEAQKPQVKLLLATPLWIADKAIGKCWDKPTTNGVNIDRINRVANKNKHGSTIEHITYSFDLVMSRACLQEFARHRMASLSVKSTRYTLKELKDEESFVVTTGAGKHDYYISDSCYLRASKYLHFIEDDTVNHYSILALENVRKLVAHGESNDKIKYCLPESYKTSLVWTVNARSLQNFLHLRSSNKALQEIRELAFKIYEQLPDDHKFLYKNQIQGGLQ